jgi:hypothetical protein
MTFGKDEPISIRSVRIKEVQNPRIQGSDDVGNRQGRTNMTDLRASGLCEDDLPDAARERMPLIVWRTYHSPSSLSVVFVPCRAMVRQLRS